MPDLSPEMPPKDLWLGRTSSFPYFPFYHPKHCCISARKKQTEQAGTSVPVQPG